MVTKRRCLRKKRNELTWDMKCPVFFLLLVLSLSLVHCKRATPVDDNSDWLADLITKFQNEPVSNPPRSIWRYDYKGQIVYYVPDKCCDQLSTLYDVDGNVICHPSGGYGGDGDGRCPDFFQERTNEMLIWKDSRSFF